MAEHETSMNETHLLMFWSLQKTTGANQKIFLDDEDVKRRLQFEVTQANIDYDNAEEREFSYQKAGVRQCTKDDFCQHDGDGVCDKDQALRFYTIWSKDHSLICMDKENIEDGSGGYLKGDRSDLQQR